MNFLQKINQVISKLNLVEKAKKNGLTKEEWEKIAAEYKTQFGTSFYSDSELADRKKTAAYDKVAAMLAECDPKKKKEEDKKKDDKKDDNGDDTGNGDGTDDNPDDNGDGTGENPDDNGDGAGENPDDNGDGTGENPDDNGDGAGENPDDNGDGTGEDPEDPEDPKKKKTNKQSVVKGVSKLIAENKNLKTKIAAMANKAGGDVKKNVASKINGLALKSNDKYLFGIENKLYSMDKRWNKIARFGSPATNPSKAEKAEFMDTVSSYGESLGNRIAFLHKEGRLNLVSLSGEAVDLNMDDLVLAGLGNQYLVRRQDELIARLLTVKTVFGVFPKRSGVQDGDLVTNAFFGEFSDAFQSGEISKGGVALQPEKAKVHKAMLKTLFEDMSELETQYIGYLNTSGSDPVKWNMIEWMMVNIGTKLIHEQSRRYVLGFRVEPVKGETHPYLLSSTGVIQRLISYVEDFKVLPIKDEEFSSYTHANMYDVVDSFVDKVAESIDNFDGKAIYLNENHKKYYRDSYRTKFGKDLDFTGELDKIVNRDDLEIQWVPNMGNIQLMFITDKGNFQCLEDVPGEMMKVYFEQHLESVWACSYWKEGTAASYAGRKYNSAAEIEAAGMEEQEIFMNWPSIEIAADAVTVDVKNGIIFTTSANTKATALTDMLHAVDGYVYTIYCGSLTNATTIAKADKFAGLTAAWTPTAVNQYIKVYYNKKKNIFVEVARG